VFLPGADREMLASGIRATVLRPVLAMQQGAVERSARFEDPDRLRAERDSLAAFLIGQSTLSTENRELRSVLGLRQKLPYAFVPAEIVRIPGRGVEGYFQLTSGGSQGIQAGSPIIAPSGLVGRVRSVDPNISFGIDWMNPEFRASAMTMDGTVYGIAEPRIGPGGEPMLALTGTPRHVQLTEGTMIVTSGHGGVFPRGIPIGKIVGVEGAETSWQRTYLIQPSVSPAEMTYVLVLGAPQETLGGKDLAVAWGIRTQAPPAVDTTLAGASAVAPAVPSASRSNAAAQDVQAPAAQAGPATPAAPPLLGDPLAPSDTTTP
jgi:rod shape-determining protein MreC